MWQRHRVGQVALGPGVLYEIPCSVGKTVEAKNSGRGTDFAEKQVANRVVRSWTLLPVGGNTGETGMSTKQGPSEHS